MRWALDLLASRGAIQPVNGEVEFLLTNGYADLLLGIENTPRESSSIGGDEKFNDRGNPLLNFCRLTPLACLLLVLSSG